MNRRALLAALAGATIAAPAAALASPIAPVETREWVAIRPRDHLFELVSRVSGLIKSAHARGERVSLVYVGDDAVFDSDHRITATIDGGELFDLADEVVWRHDSDDPEEYVVKSSRRERGVYAR